MELKQKIFAILYVAGDQGIELNSLSTILKVDVPALRQQLDKYINSNNDQIPLEIKKFGNLYKLVTKSKYDSLIRAYFKTDQATNLSQAALEVLSIVAYQQPITRVEIDQIRGVKNSSGTLQTLITRQMIKEQGRKEVPGKPIIYDTTDQFLDYFNLKSLKDLPDLDQFKEQNEKQSTDIDLFTKKGNL